MANPTLARLDSEGMALAFDNKLQKQKYKTGLKCKCWYIGGLNYKSFPGVLIFPLFKVLSHAFVIQRTNFYVFWLFVYWTLVVFV